MFSKTFGYAVRAAIYVVIHGKDGNKVSLQELSQSLEIPHHFLAKVMQDIVRHGILDSIKGPSGGFYVNDRTASTPAVEVLKITDGSLVFDQCALGIKRCNASFPCPLHDDFATCRNGMLKSLSEKTLGELSKGVDKGLSFLVR